MSWRSLLREGLATPAGNLVLRATLGTLRPLVPAAVRRRLPFRGAVSVAAPGGRSVVLQSDGRDWIAARVYWNGARSFEPETTTVFDALLAESPCVFDVGAYSGWFALRAGVTGRQVHAFEAVPETYARLVANAEANRLENLTAVWAAVGETDGETTIHAPVGADLPTSASTVEGFRPRTKAFTVPAVTLVAYADRPDVAAPDLIKIDVEGGEPSVLRGARRTLESARPFVICEVLAGLHEAFLQEYFAGLEYAFYHLQPAGPAAVTEVRGDPSYRAMNFLFAPCEKAGRFVA